VELRTSGLGRARVRIDDEGVTRGRTTIRWQEIDDYRLEIRLVQRSPSVFYLVEMLGALLMWRDAKDAMDGVHRLHFGLEVSAVNGNRVEFDWRFRDATAAMRSVLERIAGRLAEAARADLDARGRVQLGPLALAAQALAWDGREPLAREAVEAVELFDSTPVALRVMKRGKVLPYAQAPTRDIPNLCAVLDLAASLGYPVRGRELIAPVVA